jgi:hypothetical protein
VAAGEEPRSKPKRGPDEEGMLSPGDDFEMKATWASILEPHGWVCTGAMAGGAIGWRRPGKAEGTSATTGHSASNNLHVFTDGSVFEQDGSYTKFGAYALLNHQGDHAAAARELAAQGYGAKKGTREFRNYRMVEREVKLKKDATPGRSERVPLRAAEIHEALTGIAGTWPKRVGKVLFVEGADRRPLDLDSSQKLFAWADDIAMVDWKKGTKLIPQERFYEYLRMKAEEYATVETLPHWPPLPGVYYMHAAVPELEQPSGRLEQFLDFFLPETDIDRQLIRALILTTFWGGEPGCRPAFLICGPERDDEQGRGVGKTTLVDVVSLLAGGAIAFAPSEDIEKIRIRLLSPGARQKRIARLDNLKTLRFSWSDLEDLLTAPEISGRALYIGEGCRPNTLVWCITLNGASLSKDLAKRIVTIRLRRPVFDATWLDRVKAFIEQHRLELLADIKHALESKRDAGEVATRWGPWEAGVLSRVDDPQACRQVILARQKQADDDDETRSLVAERFAEELRKRGHDPDREYVRIPHSEATRWLNAVISPRGKELAANRASSELRNLQLPQLKKIRTEAGAAWDWRVSARRNQPCAA